MVVFSQGLATFKTCLTHMLQKSHGYVQRVGQRTNLVMETFEDHVSKIPTVIETLPVAAIVIKANITQQFTSYASPESYF